VGDGDHDQGDEELRPVASSTSDATGRDAGADLAGYQRLLDFAQAQLPGRRCWAVEGAGSYGAGLTASCRPSASGWSRLRLAAQAVGAPHWR
jgi:hypothetical protein